MSSDLPNRARIVRTQEPNALARLNNANAPVPAVNRNLADLSVAQRLDPGSLVLLSRLSSGTMGGQALVQGEDNASTTGKLIAGEYFISSSPTLAQLAPLLARSDYSEADILYLLAAYSAPGNPLTDKAIADAIVASRSPIRRFWLWIKAHSSIWPD